MGETEGNPKSKLVAVQLADLDTLASFACEHTIHGHPTCDEAEEERGGCCNSCWARRFAERAKRGESTNGEFRDQPKEIDIHDLFGGLGETIEQLGGKFAVDLEHGFIYIVPPKWEQDMRYLLLVVKELPVNLQPEAGGE